MAEKSPDAFRTISEVSDWLDTPTYVLRFWESRFPQIKPVKRAGGRRYYRPEDMMLLGGIKKLLHFDDQTIKAVKGLLKDKGVKHVMSLSPDLDTPVESPQPAADKQTTADLDKMVDDAVQAKAAKPSVSIKVVKKPKEPAPEDTRPAVPEEQGEAVAKHKEEPDQPQLEDWEKETPAIIDARPLAVRASRQYDIDNLTEIAALYDKLVQVRDRLRAAVQ